ncbi:MAG TPA: transglycosylase SLT domain-containing protein [Chloroflexota bacterium]|nr:transglycosylase SLT domain-containing protein [Chloroflexota bacterium]
MQPRRTLHFAALVLVALASACQSAAPVTSPPAAPTSTTAPAQPTQAAAPTADAAPTQPPAPTVAAKPTATPLSTTPISTLDKLADAQRTMAHDGQLAIAAGDYSRAIGLLEPLASQVSGDPQSEVRLLLGQALVGDRQFDKALATSETLLGAASRADLVSAGRLLKGEVLRGLQRWDEAASEMRAVADSNPLVAAGVRLELEEMWLDAKRPDQAAADGQAGLDLAEPRLLKIELAEKLGNARVALGQTDAALDAYRQLLTAAGTKGYLGEQLYNLAVGASALGRNDDAIRALRTSISEFPRSRKAPDGVELLEKLGGMRAEDRFFAGLIRYYFWNFRGARADFDAYLAALPDGDRAIDARYYRALSSQPKDTTDQLLKLAQQFPDDDFAPMALLEAGKAQEELKDYASAERIYDQLVGSYSTRDAGLEGAFRRGLARYMHGDLAGALAAWDDLLSRERDGPVRAKALYWSGKVLAARGNPTAARDKFVAAASVRPVDYYVIRAEVELEPPPDSSGFDSSKISPADESALADWFAQHNLNLKAAAQAAGSDPAYLRSVALVQHGLYKQANWEHEAFLTTYADKSDRLYWLAARFGEMGLPNAELKLGTAALNGATAEGQVSILDVPRALARVASPLAFPDLVAPIAERRGIDPLLFTSLMHQESDFDPYAESVAKAKGLTQIIPKTGNEIADALGVRNFRQEELFQPKRSVEFGSWYFGQRLRRNGGSVNKALAAYNAGDGNVDTWTAPGREDPDVFAEYVSFEETHNYVKRIQQYWWINRYIWGQA